MFFKRFKPDKKMRTFLYLMLLSPWWGCSQTPKPSYSEADSAVEVRAGSTFAIQLPSNIGTGYRWELKEQPDAALLTLVKQEHRSGASTEDNAEGLDHFLFETHKKGDLQLRFWFVRPWKKDKADDPSTKEKTYTVTIR